MFNTLKRAITQKNYDSVEDMKVKLFAFYSTSPQMITESEYNTLTELLLSKKA